MHIHQPDGGLSTLSTNADGGATTHTLGESTRVGGETSPLLEHNTESASKKSEDINSKLHASDNFSYRESAGVPDKIKAECDGPLQVQLRRDPALGAHQPR